MNRRLFGQVSRGFQQRGFTLLELLVVVGILATLVAMALPFYQDYVAQSRAAVAQSDLATFRKALALYDQRESTAYTRTDFLGLIGKYLAEFRSDPADATQVAPKDPWGFPYQIDPQRGLIWSSGENGTNESGGTTMVPLGDDLGVTWKPEFFISSVEPLAANRVRVNFSRRLDSSVSLSANYANFTVTNPNLTAQAPCAYESKTSIVFTLTGAMTQSTTHDFTIADGANITAADGRLLRAANKNELGTAANVRRFNY